MLPPAFVLPAKKSGDSSEPVVEEVREETKVSTYWGTAVADWLMTSVL